MTTLLHKFTKLFLTVYRKERLQFRVQDSIRIFAGHCYLYTRLAHSHCYAAAPVCLARSKGSPRPWAELFKCSVRHCRQPQIIVPEITLARTGPALEERPLPPSPVPHSFFSDVRRHTPRTLHMFGIESLSIREYIRPEPQMGSR